jgi:deoxyribonucleoside regulator
MEFKDTRETLANIATLYYLADMSQDEIAEMYNISRYKVSRVLKKCKAMKIVEFHINNQLSHYKKLEKQIEELFGLKQVILTLPGSTLEESKTNVGKAAARYLTDNLRNDMMIGLSWGTTVQKMVQHFTPQRKYEDVTFLQLSGNVCSDSVKNQNYMDGREIVQAMAQKAGVNWSVYQVPYIVKNKTLKTLLLNENEIAAHVKKFDKLNMAFIGLGSSAPEKSVSYTSGYITLEESQKLVDEGMGADICGTRVNIRGEICASILTDRVLTISPEELKKTPEVIAVAAGADKALSLVAGARGGFFNHAIIDEIAAFSMINMAKII